MNKFPHLNPHGTPAFKDSQLSKVTELIRSWDGKETVSNFGLLGLPLSKPSISHSGACFAPTIIRKALQSYSTYAIEEDVDLNNTITDFGDVAMHVTSVAESNKRIKDALSSILSTHNSMIPIILGGDHSVTAPSVDAFSKVKGNIGIIQFDAHHDLRNLDDGGPSNGTPFRQLIEGGHLKGKHLLQIGIRNFSNSRNYFDYAKENEVTVLTMQQVNELSLKNVINDWLRNVKSEVDAIYVSVDMDVLDQAYAPGCPAIGPGGMTSETLLDAIRHLGTLEEVQAIDIVEIDPTLDFRDMTSKVAAHVILNFLLGKQKK
ncbi:formimidoylglutamase [Lottiidibacillus patelloidae]|uniref:Formimidoylglutamase n=1 Tax=Lottiidibacillus patelloidae TaxID=2670334 RepID=A0A263BU22_9BACI|nr:formimidoylglutamase [Lottiidibacillus patelloidae]OZM57219.1 formimidoylglutamase [Lottiidibacillus patelloidae]